MENLCAENITIDSSNCLIPCQGIYADVTKTEADKIDGIYYETLLKNYKRYKRFFDVSEGNHFFLYNKLLRLCF